MISWFELLKVLSFGSQYQEKFNIEKFIFVFLALNIFIYLLNSNTCFGSQSLSDSIRIIFLTCPPVDEEKVRGNTRYVSQSLEHHFIFLTIAQR